MKNPCYKCVERVFGCHSGCDRYMAWKSEQTELREAIRDARQKEQALLDEPFRAVERSKR